MKIKECLSNITTKDINVNVKNIINFILYSTIILMPFLVTKDYNSPFLGLKLLFMYICSVVLIGCALLSKKEVFTLYIEKVIVICYFISLVFTTINAIEPSIGLVGMQNRGEGLIIYSIYFLMFLMSVKYLKVTVKTINLVLLASVIMAIHIIVQFYGFDLFLSIVNNKIMSFGAIGTIGNRNFSATYILIFSCIAIPLYIFKGGKKYLIYSCILFAALLATFTRGCWMALGIVLLIGLFMIIKRKDLWKRAIIVVICFITIFIGINVTGNGSLMNRVETISSELDRAGTEGIGVLGSTRIEIWTITLKSIKKHPIQGAGLDSLQLRLNRDVLKDHTNYTARTNSIIDKAHNDFLEIWACGGLFSLLIYITLLFIILRKLIRLIKLSNDDNYRVILLCILGYVIQSAVNISMVATAPIYWIILGFAVQSYREKEMRGL